jgi:hypothetical protein
MTEHISLVAFMFEYATAIMSRVALLTRDEQQPIHELMFDALCAAHKRDAQEVKRLIAVVEAMLPLPREGVFPASSQSEFGHTDVTENPGFSDA